MANPVRSSAQSDSVRTQYEFAGYQAQVAAVGRQLLGSRKRLAELDKETASYNTLNDNVARLTDLDHDYRQKADAARVSQMLDEKHISNVAVAEDPFAPGQATSPKVAAILVVSFSGQSWQQWA